MYNILATAALEEPMVLFSCFAQIFTYETNEGVSPEAFVWEISIHVGTWRFEPVRVNARSAQAPVRASLSQFDQVPLSSTEKNINYFWHRRLPRSLSQSYPIDLPQYAFHP